VIFDFVWPLTPADELLVTSGRDEQVVRFRSELLQIIVPSLAGLVELELRREVTGSLPAMGDDSRHAMISFALGDRKGEDREAADALRNWSLQEITRARGSSR
jgi:hypothetical protein